MLPLLNIQSLFLPLPMGHIIIHAIHLQYQQYLQVIGIHLLKKKFFWCVFADEKFSNIYLIRFYGSVGFSIMAMIISLVGVLVTLVNSYQTVTTWWKGPPMIYTLSFIAGTVTLHSASLVVVKSCQLILMQSTWRCGHQHFNS